MSKENPPEQTSPQTPRSRRAAALARYRRSKSFRILFVLAALLLVVGGILFWRWFSSFESTDDAQVDVHLYPVSARITGHVIKVNVGDNEFVQKGTLLSKSIRGIK